jgi:hypothetical protein
MNIKAPEDAGLLCCEAGRRMKIVKMKSKLRTWCFVSCFNQLYEIQEIFALILVLVCRLLKQMAGSDSVKLAVEVAKAGGLAS